MLSNIDRYKSFYYTASLHSFSSAAKKLYISQSAVSQSVKKIEEELGARLFVRSSNNLKLTKEGEILYSYISRSLQEMAAGEKVVKNFADTKRKHLRLGATETAIRFYLPDAIKQIKTFDPDLTISLEGATTDDLCQLLSDQKIDAAWLISPMINDYAFDLKKIADIQDYPVVSKRFFEQHISPLLKVRKSLSLLDITALPVITVSQRNSFRTVLDSYFLENGSILTPDYTVQTTSLMLPIIEADLGIGFLPANYLNADNNLFSVPLKKLPPKRQLFLATRANEPLPEALYRQRSAGILI